MAPGLLYTLKSLFFGFVVLAGTLVWGSTTESRFQRTVLAVEASTDQELKARFASTALLELAEVYLAESDLARAEAGSAGQQRKLATWSQAVDRYAEGLFRLLEEIELGSPVSLRLNQREVPSVSVDGRTVMLAHPRNGQQAEYEHRVLDAFCTGITCSALTAPPERAAIPLSANSIVPLWTFTEQGPVCHYRGIRVSFRSDGAIAAQKALCQQLMQELEILATEIAWQQRHGVEVIWDELRIKSTPGKTDHLVTLNSSGDSILASLPLTYSSPLLLPSVMNWLQKRFTGAASVELSLRAADQGWE